MEGTRPGGDTLPGRIPNIVPKRCAGEAIDHAAMISPQWFHRH
jgi:hypothetical protein